MGERKVINNYISPDFDPSLIPKIKRSKDRTIETRMMLPFSMQCNTCGEYLYRGKKFNSKMEICKGEDYMGIRRFRFYIKCSVCSAEISFKTDPKNTDYECESGASRNFEVWRDTEQAQDEVKQQREEEDEHDTMKALENRTLDSKIEMDVLDALDEIKAINQRHERVDTNAVLASLHRVSNKTDSAAVLQNGLTAEDEALVRSIKFKSTDTHNTSSTGNGASSSSAEVESESTLDQAKDRANSSINSGITLISAGGGTGAASLLHKQMLQQQFGAAAAPAPAAKQQPVIVVRKRKADVSSGAGSAQPAKVSNTAQPSASASTVVAAAPAPVAAPVAAPAAAASMFGDYGDDSD